MVSKDKNTLQVLKISFMWYSNAFGLKYTSQKKKRYTDFMLNNLSDNTHTYWSELLNITRRNFNKDKNLNKTD